MDNLFLTVEEAATQLNVNPETIRRRIRRGAIKAQLLPGPRGDQYSIPASELVTQEAQIIPVPELHPAIVSQISAALSQAVSEAVEPLQQKIEEQSKEIADLKENIKNSQDVIQQQALAIHHQTDRLINEFINETRAERRKAAEKSWWKFWD